MQNAPFNIATIRSEETAAFGDRVKVTAFDVRPNQVCLGVIAPAEMTVSSSPERKLLEAKGGTRMVPLCVGDSLSIGSEITLLVLIAQDGKVRLGVNTVDLLRKPSNVNGRRIRLRKSTPRGRGRGRRVIHLPCD